MLKRWFHNRFIAPHLESEILDRTLPERGIVLGIDWLQGSISIAGIDQRTYAQAVKTESIRLTMAERIPYIISFCREWQATDVVAENKAVADRYWKAFVQAGLPVYPIILIPPKYQDIHKLLAGAVASKQLVLLEGLPLDQMNYSQRNALALAWKACLQNIRHDNDRS